VIDQVCVDLSQLNVKW